MNGRNRAALAVTLLLGAAGALSARDTADIGKRTTLALTYREGDGTRVDMFAVKSPSRELGHADVKRDDGRTRVKLAMDQDLPHPQSLGSLYTTYVLWAVAPEGRAENLAELPPEKDFTVEATTSLPTFGLIVTAEPHSLVSRPGPWLVAENRLRSDTRARVQTGTVAYDAAPERRTDAGTPDFKTALPLLGARRAVEIARAADATTYAEPELREAEVKLAALDERWSGHDKLSKDAEVTAREVMRLAEQARTLSAERMADAGRRAERRAARSAINQAQTEAVSARTAAERERDRAARAGEQAALANQQAVLASQDAARAADEAARSRARETEAQTDAERARAEAERARLDAQAALQDKAEMQEELYRSLSAILETRREARGLIVNLSDVLFDFNKASLKPGAREKLSKLSGILMAYPGPYHIEIEGHTDAVGSDTYNLGLSQDRADSVRSYITTAGIAADRVTRVTGFGEARPVATNDTASGRQVNRRVELVITDLDRP